MENPLRATECHLPYGTIVDHKVLPATQHTGKRTPFLFQPSKPWYTIYLPRRDRRL